MCKLVNPKRSLMQYSTVQHTTVFILKRKRRSLGIPLRYAHRLIILHYVSLLRSHCRIHLGIMEFMTQELRKTFFGTGHRLQSWSLNTHRTQSASLSQYGSLWNSFLPYFFSHFQPSIRPSIIIRSVRSTTHHERKDKPNRQSKR